MNQDEYNQKQLDEGKVSGEHITKLTELWQKEHGLKQDGKLGPATLADIGTTTPLSEATTEPKIQVWKPFDGPLEHLPRNRKDVYAIFGDPSNGSKANKKWENENIRTFRKDMALPGVDPHRYVKLHRLAEPYVREAMRRATSVSDYEITRFGGYVYRLMRGKSRLSYHSFGIAFDINPPENKAIRFESAADKPVPFSDEWHELYPDGMDQAFVDAIKSVGFGWGGDWRTFSDPMHFELVLP